jgi:hypothetical protein
MSTSNRDGRVHGKGAHIAILFLALALLAPGTTGALNLDAAAEAQPAEGQAIHPVAKAQPQAQGQSSNAQPDLSPSPLTAKQQRALLKANYTKLKQDADELADLAKSLQDELNKSNENVLSLDVVEKADRIEKLAKKIKSAAVQ